VIGVLEIAQHGGMILPLVQTRTLQPGQMATLFWFCAAVGAVLTACGWLAAPLSAGSSLIRGSPRRSRC
jgi:hypothetical protein